MAVVISSSLIASSEPPLPSSSLSSSSAPESSSSAIESSSSSSSETTSSSSTTTSIRCDYRVTDDGGYYYAVRPLTITNTGTAPLTNWSVTLDLGKAPSGSLNNVVKTDVTEVSLTGQILTLSGATLAVNASAKVEFALSFTNHKVGMPACVLAGSATASSQGSTSSSIAPPPPPVGTGPVAKGQCAANTGLGNGSASYGVGYAVLDDGSAVHVKNGEVAFLKYSDGSRVTGAVAITNGSYSDAVCVALTNGAVHCGAYSMISKTPRHPAGSDIVYLTTGSGIDGSSCGLTGSGNLLCSIPGDAALASATKPFHYASCSRKGCCVIDANDRIQCTAGSPTKEPAATPLIVAGNDGGYCGVYSDGKSYCWGSGFGGAFGDSPNQNDPVAPTGFTVNQPVVSYAGGQFTSCWVNASSTVTCSGNGGGTAAGAGGGGESPSLIKDASGKPIENIIAVNGGRGSACAASRSGDLYCWGSAGGKAEVAVKLPLGDKKVRMPVDCAL